MSDPAIRVEGIAKKYGATVALSSVSFSVEPGEMFGLIGPDGAGKTTLMRILASLVDPDEGRGMRCLGFRCVPGPRACARRSATCRSISRSIPISPSPKTSGSSPTSSEFRGRRASHGRQSFSNSAASARS